MKLIRQVLIHVCLLVLAIQIVGLRKPAGPAEGSAASKASGRAEKEDRLAANGYAVTAAISNRAVYSPKLPEEPEFLLPYALAHLINGADKNADSFLDFKSIWERLRIEKDSEGVFDGFTPSYSPWRVEIVTAKNPNAARLVILFIYADGGSNRRCLVFRQSKTSWQVVGSIDILDNKYEGSPHERYHRVITNDRNTWLALRQLAVSGTGAYQVNEVWYEIGGNRPQKVLEYPVTGYFANDDVCNRVFGAHIIGEEASGADYRVRILFSVYYYLDTFSVPKLEKKARAIYAWNPTLSKFVLDKSISDVDEKEIEDVYNTGFLSDSKFLVYNFKGLSRISIHGSERQREWARDIFNKIKARRE